MTTISTKAKDIKRMWHLIDVDGQILGRISTNIAHKLMGKSKPYFVRNLDCGDYVVVINAPKVKVTGNKIKQKIYDSFSGYPGGRKKHTFEYMVSTNPERIIYEAVSGMLPKNKLRDSMLKRLYIYKDSNHPYTAKIKS